MTGNSRKCIRLLKKNSSLMDLFAIILLALFNLPKKKTIKRN